MEGLPSAFVQSFCLGYDGRVSQITVCARKGAAEAWGERVLVAPCGRCRFAAFTTLMRKRALFKGQKSPQTLVHSPAHSPQNIVHRPQPTANTPQTTDHSPQTTVHSPQPAIALLFHHHRGNGSCSVLGDSRCPAEMDREALGF